VQKSHDFQLTDPVSVDSDLILVQTRDPTLRSLSNYELALRARKIEHTPEHLAYYLAREALYDVRFHEKWIKPARPHVQVVHYEDLLRSPEAIYRDFFARLNLETTQDEIDRILESLGTQPGKGIPFTPRKMETSKYFDKDLHRQFLGVLASEADNLGYEPWDDATPVEGVVGPIYRALRARRRGEYAEVIVALESLEIAKMWRGVRRLKAEALAHTSGPGAGRGILKNLLKKDPDFLPGYLALATAYSKSGEKEQYRATIQAAIDNTGDITRIRRYLSQRKDIELLESLPEAGETPNDATVSPQEVLAAFRWLVGREPKPERLAVLHSRCRRRDAIRAVILRSHDFKGFFERHADLPIEKWRRKGASAEPVSADDVREGFWIILGREADDEAVASHLHLRSRNELRYELLTSAEFRSSFAQLKDEETSSDDGD